MKKNDLEIKTVLCNSRHSDVPTRGHLGVVLAGNSLLEEAGKSPVIRDADEEPCLEDTPTRRRFNPDPEPVEARLRTSLASLTSLASSSMSLS